jgi:hypothetical protein
VEIVTEGIGEHIGVRHTALAIATSSSGESLLDVFDVLTGEHFKTKRHDSVNAQEERGLERFHPPNCASLRRFKIRNDYTGSLKHIELFVRNLRIKTLHFGICCTVAKAEIL